MARSKACCLAVYWDRTKRYQKFVHSYTILNSFYKDSTERSYDIHCIARNGDILGFAIMDEEEIAISTDHHVLRCCVLGRAVNDDFDFQ